MNNIILYRDLQRKTFLIFINQHFYKRCPYSTCLLIVIKWESVSCFTCLANTGEVDPLIYRLNRPNPFMLQH